MGFLGLLGDDLTRDQTTDEWIPDTPPWHVHNLGILLLPPSRPRVCQMHFSEWEFYILRSIHSTWEHTRAPRVRTGCEGVHQYHMQWKEDI